MPISNYTTLQSEIADWLARDDLTAKIPTLIQLAEAKIGRKLRRKTLRGSLPLDEYAVDLTQLASFGELRSLHLTTGMPGHDGPVRIGSPEQLAEIRQTYSLPGVPRWGCVVGDELLLGPTPDQTYSAEATYYEKLQPLADAVTGSNSILIEAPDIYLWGALMMAAPYLEHDERIPTWKTSFDEGIAELDAQREREEYTAGIRPVRLPVVYG